MRRIRDARRNSQRKRRMSRASETEGLPADSTERERRSCWPRPRNSRGCFGMRSRNSKTHWTGSGSTAPATAIEELMGEAEDDEATDGAEPYRFRLAMPLPRHLTSNPAAADRMPSCMSRDLSSC
jgi:hypothetical protein